MDTATLLQIQFGTLERQFKQVLKDLSLEQLRWQPVPQANSIGFLLWHLLYTWDDYMGLIVKRDTLYEQEGWPERFGFDTRGLGVEGSGMGTGFTPEEVAIVRPGPEPLLDYLRSLLDEMSGYLQSANNESLGAKVSVPWWRPKGHPAARVLSHIIAHSYFHLGEAQFSRGLESTK
jgi:uncharacterized damage-inducible protein DinB